MYHGILIKTIVMVLLSDYYLRRMPFDIIDYMLFVCVFMCIYLLYTYICLLVFFTIEIYHAV